MSFLDEILSSWRPWGLRTRSASRVVISYRREDSSPYAGRLYDRLVAKLGAQNVFVDFLIPLGQNFVEVVEERVRSCDVMLVLIGNQWLTATDSTGRTRLSNPDDFVNLEISAALAADRFIVPVLVGGALMPRASELPESVRALAHRNAFVLADAAFEEGVERVVRTINLADRTKAASTAPKGKGREQITIQLAREAARVVNLRDIGEILIGLPLDGRGISGPNKRIEQRALGIVQLQNRLDTIDRPKFREHTAELLLKEVEDFLQSTDDLPPRLSAEFRSAATHWESLARKQLSDIRTVITKGVVPQVFRAGDPVDRDREAFVPRDRIVGQLEQQIMLSTGCPGVILYGRRRTGKSTVLKNLAGFLPPNVAISMLSMQEPEAFQSLESFVNLVKTRVRSIESGSQQATLADLFSFLSEANLWLESGGRRLVLAIDEYEYLDMKIGQRVLPMELLDAIRESIQSHRAITWVFAGSHEITDLPNAHWTNYLVSARLIEVTGFTPAETRLLLTEPGKNSRLLPRDSPDRPRFSELFWGPGGIDRIHTETGGWPHLVQLVAETAIDLFNDSTASFVTQEVLDEALRTSIVRGHAVLFELLQRESRLPGEWEYLEGFRTRDEQQGPQNQLIRRSLLRRELITAHGETWRLRVPLMQRWLRERV